MERESSKLMTPFDCQTIPQWIYNLKLMLPYTPPTIQHSLAVFIRFQEMQFTLKHFNGFGKKRHYDNIINDVKPYMDPSTQEMMEQMESMMSMMEMMQTLNGSDSQSPEGFNPLDMFSDLFAMKGDNNHE